MRMSHTTVLSARVLQERCHAIARQLTGNEPDDEYFLDVFDLGIDREDLSGLLANLIDHGIDDELELSPDDDWEGAFTDAISAY